MSRLDRRQLAKGLVFSAAVGHLPGALAQPAKTKEPAFTPWSPIEAGVWKATLGAPEAFTPVRMRQRPPQTAGLAILPAMERPPLDSIGGTVSGRGALVRIPLSPGERVYGLGLQMYSLQQRGKKKMLRVNANPAADTGDSHAPVSFLVTGRGYGILIDSARYITIDCGDTTKKSEISDAPGETGAPSFPEASSILIEIPRSAGVDVYLFGGPTMLAAVQRYNLFSGGGCVPPEWGLGFWYRADAKADARQVTQLGKEFRDRRIPCDVMGLEPGWQTHAYSCTYLWNKQRYPDPAEFVKTMGAMDYEVNLWEHAFTNPKSPLFEPLQALSGDFSVWNGLVPDFASPSARKIFGGFHRKNLIDLEISGFKLDECDNSDLTGAWSFPEVSHFPSGLDGEQMHSLFGLRYQDTILEQFRLAGKQTYGLVRSSGALAAPYPFVLYTDLYDHKIFIRALVNSGFSGVLWCPEVRDAKSAEDLIRRLQSVVFSPLAMVNGWYIKNPPWKQQDFEKNNADEFDPHWEELEAHCRKVIEWRMELIPYLLSAFHQYASAGLPPFRALALDRPEDARLADIDDQYLVGDRMLVAPFFAGDTSRSVVLPQGDWCDYWTGAAAGNGVTITVPAELDKIPVYVKSGSVFPMGGVGLSTKDPQCRQITVRVYGDGSLPFRLNGDGGRGWELSWDATAKKGREAGGPAGKDAYTIAHWQQMGVAI